MGKDSDDVNRVIRFQYRFILARGLERTIDVNLDKKTLNLIQPKRESYPEWTALESFQCPNCSLDVDNHVFCPIAVNLVGLVDFFRDMISYKEVDLLIRTSINRDVLDEMEGLFSAYFE